MEDANQMAPFPVFDTEVISDAKKIFMLSNKELSDREPVSYCKVCLSLKVKVVTVNKDNENEEEDIVYCDSCSNTEIGEAHITEWEDMYEEKYQTRFITKKK